MAIHLTRFLATIVLVLVAAICNAAAPIVPAGDGIAAIEAFDPARQTVLLGSQPVALLPSAAASLQRQLTEQGRPIGQPFTAKFTVRHDVSGQAVIETIYVPSLKRR